MPKPRMTAKDRARLAADRLKALYPAVSELEHTNAFQMLVATILSAQTTDRSVNSVTPALFARYPDAAALAHANPAEVEAMIKPTGFFHVKAKTIIAASAALIERFQGEVPSRIEDLVTLPGVGRKTANVVLCVAFGIPGFAVDILILFVALTARGAVSEGLAIFGSIVTVSGLILLVQDATDHFESWAYAWTLIVPGAIGLGMILYGLTARRPGNVRSGTRLVGIALVLFLLGGAFFEGIVGLSGYQLDHIAGVVLGALIIALGALMLVLNLTSSGRRSR